MTFYSSIYGLGITLNQKIPGIVLSESAASSVDINIFLGCTPDWFHPHEIRGDVWYLSPGQEPNAGPRLVIWKLLDGRYYYFRYSDGTEFLIESRGTEVWATWPGETLTLEDTATYLLGPIMGFVLLLRGTICLHASAIVIGKQAIALLGPAGSGKSTTAAAFANRGYGILAEDVVSLSERGTTFCVEPGYPCIRLWPHSVEALYGTSHELPKLTPTWDKCFLDLSQERYTFHEQSLPLAAVYLLAARSEDPAAPYVQRLSQAQALMSLVANTYATNLMDREMRAYEFGLLSRLAGEIPVRQITPSDNAEHLGHLCDTIIEDFEVLSTRSHV
jgi:hypothetical protein